MKPYRCAACGRKFFRSTSWPGSRISRRRGQSEAELPSSPEGLTAQDNRDFERLIRDMAEAEQRAGLGGPPKPPARPRAKKGNPEEPASLEELKQREDALDGFVRTGTQGVKRKVVAREGVHIEPGEGEA